MARAFKTCHTADEIFEIMNQEKLTIPKIMHVIWVGSNPAPMKWIDTWKEKHPDWKHVFHDNDAIFGRAWINQRLIDAYREKEEWPGVADVARYEILYETGGAMHGADSICLARIDELFTDHAYDCYTVYENEKVKPGLAAPLYACTKHNAFAKQLIDGLKDVEPGPAWKTTGNLYMKKMIERYHPSTLKIWPSYTLLPEHWSGEKYEGDGKVYATHKWGSTFANVNRYQEGT